jgi:hypothetical protein
VDFEACDLLISHVGSGTIHTTGDGGGSFRAAGSESIIINSVTNSIRSDGSNSLFYLRDLPLITALGVFSPTETKTEDVALGLCKPPFDGISRRPICDVDGDGEYNRRFGGTDCNDADPEIVGDSPSCTCGPVPPPRHGETPMARCAIDPYPLVFPLDAICPEFVTDTGAPDTGAPDTGTTDTGTTDTGTPDTETPDTGDISPPDGDGSDDTASVDGSGSDEVQATAGAVRCGCASSVASGSALWLFGLLIGLRRRQTQ